MEVVSDDSWAPRSQIAAQTFWRMLMCLLDMFPVWAVIVLEGELVVSAQCLWAAPHLALGTVRLDPSIKRSCNQCVTEPRNDLFHSDSHISLYHNLNLS